MCFPNDNKMLIITRPKGEISYRINYKQHENYMNFTCSFRHQQENMVCLLSLDLGQQCLDILYFQWNVLKFCLSLYILLQLHKSQAYGNNWYNSDALQRRKFCISPYIRHDLDKMCKWQALWLILCRLKISII